MVMTHIITRTVHKYPLELKAGEQCLLLPPGARVVHVHEQFGAPALWVDVYVHSQDAPEPEARDFAVTPTGEPVPDGARHLGTTHIHGLVFHVWEVTR
jgi:hypothetical protein